MDGWMDGWMDGERCGWKDRGMERGLDGRGMDIRWNKRMNGGIKG